MRRFYSVLVLLCATVTALNATASIARADSPIYDIKATWGNTNLLPGGKGQFVVQVRNVGAGESSGKESLTISDQLPAGVTATHIHWGKSLGSLCLGLGTGLVSCNAPAVDVAGLLPAPGAGKELTTAAPTGYAPQLFIDVAMDAGASGTAINTATVSGGGAPTAVDVDEVPFSSTPAAFGIVPGSFSADAFDAAYPFGSPSRQAGDRPYELRVGFDLTAETVIGNDASREIKSTAPIKTAEVTLPRGFIGNPEATPKCDIVDFAQTGALLNSTACPSNTQVGYINVSAAAGGFSNGRGQFANPSAVLSRVPIYNLVPPKGVPADFGFAAGGFVQAHIYPNLDPSQDYAIKTVTPDISSAVLTARGSEVSIWAVPGDPAHDKFRYFSKETNGKVLGASFEGPIRPLLTNPTDCGFDNGGAGIRVSSYSDPGNFTKRVESASSLNVEGCDDPRFRFEPEVSLQPTSRAAGAPTGLDVHLKVPQRSDTVSDSKELYAQNGYVKGIPTPPMKKAVVTFPKGMTLNPAAAQGLGSCDPEQIGLGTDAPVTCPASSQYGTLLLHTPILPVNAQPEGFVYIAKQNDNPFHNFLSLYLVIQEPERGILVKVPGRVDLDPQTGQITTTFDDLPQFPVSDMQMTLKGGLRAGLVNPQVCGKQTIEATFYSWQDPATPHVVDSSFDITQNPDGSPCYRSPSERPFDPRLSGGTLNNRAGAYSPMELRLTRSDEDQELSKVEGTGPPGLLASIRGVSRCTDAAIAAASNPSRTGGEEINSPSCPASSLVGSVDAGAGVGQVLTYVKGKVYLAGPYKGAPLSGVAIVPAVAGPFDLGTIVTRAPAFVNPKTAELHLVTDPLPLIFKGVPVRVRDVQIHLDRSHFTLNPTNCEPFSFTGTLFSAEGKTKADSSHFQAADCATLGFKPRLKVQLFGGTHRGAHPKLRGTFKAREGDANAASAVVTLPHSEFLDQSHIRTICTRIQFAADACPAASVYGHAVAKTPLLDEDLQGPVYLRSSSHNLPDLVADLHGIVDVEVIGRIDSVNGGIRASFDSVPDAPVEEFTIAMQGGKKGLLVNSTEVCAGRFGIRAEFRAQNGRRRTLRPRLDAGCSKQHSG